MKLIRLTGKKKKSGGCPSGNPPEISDPPTDPIDPIEPDCPECELEERWQRSWENLAANIIAHDDIAHKGSKCLLTPARLTLMIWRLRARMRFFFDAGRFRIDV